MQGDTAGPPRAARFDITLVFFVHGAVYANWVPRIPLLKERLGLGEGGLGIALLGAPIGVVLAVRVASWAVGRWGSRAVTRGAAVAACVTLAPIAHTWNLASLLGALLLIGASLGVMDVAMNAQGVVVERRYGRPIMSGLHGWYSVGALAGALTGSAAAHWDIPVGVHFSVAAGVLAAAVWLGSRRLLPDEAGKEPTGASAGSTGLGDRAPGAPSSREAVPGRRARRLTPGSGTVLLLGIIGLCSFVGEGAVADWSSVFLREDLAASAGAAGLGYAGCAVAMAAGRLSGDRLVARFGPVAVLRAGSLVSAAGLAVGLLSGAQAVAVAGFTLFGLGIAPVAPVTFSAAGNLPEVPAATAISRVTGIGYLGFLGGPPAIGFVAEVVGLGWALAIPAALAAVMALLAGAVRPAASPGGGQVAGVSRAAAGGEEVRR